MICPCIMIVLRWKIQQLLNMITRNAEVINLYKTEVRLIKEPLIPDHLA